MPVNPIKPVHMLEEHAELFDYNHLHSSMSPMQMALMGGEVREACSSGQKFSEATLKMLECIHESEDDTLTVAQSLGGKSGKVYRVPSHVNDNQLLGLKTQGLIAGNGRAVSITDRGRVALRDHWLSSDNNLRANRTKNKFDLRAATASGHGKFNRVSQSQISGKKFNRVAQYPEVLDQEYEQEFLDPRDEEFQQKLQDPEFDQELEMQLQPSPKRVKHPMHLDPRLEI